jgi:hypothetical protein
MEYRAQILLVVQLRTLRSSRRFQGSCESIVQGNCDRGHRVLEALKLRGTALHLIN